MSEKLLIVEDDKKLNDGIRLALKNDSYFFYQCQTLQKAREILKKEDITLVLLDVNLPDGNGIDFVREIRKNSQVPIILLTVNNMEVDIVTGLEAGANDYITKPFSLMVLRARVSVQLIIPGIEALAPERTETSSGFSLSPNFFPVTSSIFVIASMIWPMISSLIFLPSS